MLGNVVKDQSKIRSWVFAYGEDILALRPASKLAELRARYANRRTCRSKRLFQKQSFLYQTKVPTFLVGTFVCEAAIKKIFLRFFGVNSDSHSIKMLFAPAKSYLTTYSLFTITYYFQKSTR